MSELRTWIGGGHSNAESAFVAGRARGEAKTSTIHAIASETGNAFQPYIDPSNCVVEMSVGMGRIDSDPLWRRVMKIPARERMLSDGEAIILAIVILGVVGFALT